VQNVDIKSAFKDSSFNVERCSVALDSNNHLDGHGMVRIEEPHAFQAQAEVRLPDLARFDEILKSSHQPPGLSGGLNLDASASGDFTKPAATVQLRGDQIRYRGLPIDNVRMEASLKDAQVVFGAIQIAFDPNNQIDLTGKSAIAEPYRYEFKGTVGLGDLGVFNDFLGSLGQGGGLAGVLNLQLSGQGDSKNPTVKLSLRGTQITYRGVQVQTAEVESSVNDWLCDVSVCRFTLDANNYIDLTARAGLKPPESYMTDGRIEFNNLAVFAGLLKSLGQPGTAAGELHAAWSGKGDLATLLPDAHLQVFGKDIRYRGLSIQKVDISGELAQRNLHLPSCRVIFNDKNFVDASGNAKAEEPYDYEGSAKLQFDDLGFLNELAKSFGQDIGLGGKLSASWSGKGPVSSQTGNIDFHADKLRTKSFQDIKFDATGDYHGANVEIPALKISTPYADLDASINFSPEVLEISSLSIRKNGNAISGNLKIPLDLRPGQKIPLALDQPIDVNLRGDKITLASFQPGKPSVTGTLGVQLQASKTLRNPLIEFTASAKDVRSPAVSSFSAAQADLSVRLAERDLAIAGKVTQADIHPLELSGHMPIDVGQVLESGALPENTPIQFALKWPSNNLAFVRKIVPDIKIIEGMADVDVEAKGTIKRPEVSGQIRSSIARFNAKTDTVPPLSDFVSTISFRQDRIQIDQLSGLAGGGRFSGTGSVDLKDGTNPKFDLGFKGNQVLLTRSDGIIVRANLDMSIRGPLSAGEVNGTVGITNSRFFKDIDVLPLNLPGRPPPQPPAGAPPPVSVTTPPFNAWKFNVAIRTDDPFLVQSNLARGQIGINLQAGGTGASPSVTGNVIVKRLVASLPFSKMEIDNGRVDFVQGANILDPTLSIIGRSTVRDYEVTLRIFGNVSKPTVLLDSAPPLAQGDILVLLATGATTSEFAQDPSLIAGRATFIVLQQIFGKFFPSTNRADETREPFIDRFSVNVIPGRKAGDQEISTSFRLTKNWEILGDFGSGSYQGRLKYLVRFR
jgi:autotransporter translocation and assembly factor TamB